MVHRLKFDVGGQIYSISSSALEAGPESKLTRMYKSGTTLAESACIEIDRPADMFASVLAMYQTGELHFPTTSCPGAFLNELEFWEISTEVVENCCFNRLQSFVDEQETLKKFRDSREAYRKHFCYSDQVMKSFQGKLWNIVDYSKPSVLGRFLCSRKDEYNDRIVRLIRALEEMCTKTQIHSYKVTVTLKDQMTKIYFMVSLSMVLLSICTLAFSTDPYFRRQMTNCERLEYMESSGMEKIELARKWLKRDCNNDKLPDHRPPPWMHTPHLGGKNGCKTEFKTSVKVYFPYYQDDDDDDYESSSNDSDLIFDGNNQSTNPLIPDNYSDDVSVATSPSTSSKTSKTPTMIGEYVELPDYNIQMYAFFVLESVTVVYFTIDTIFRLLSCPSRKWYFLSIINFTDILALLGSYLHFILMQIYKHEQYRDSWMDMLKYLQVLRSLRLFRAVSNVRAGQVLAYTIRENFKDLSILILFLIVGMSSFASCMFVVEEREDFRSIPVGWYWALVTMTTVGYGDIVPKTAMGRVMACVCAFSGIILLALTVPVFANNFLTLYQFANSEKAVKKYQHKKSKVKMSENDVKVLGRSTFEGKYS